MKTAEVTNLEMEHVKKLTRNCLASCSAMDLNEMCMRLRLDRSAVVHALHMLVDSGEVEILRPERFGGRAHAGREHYRLIRTTDNDYTWEQEIVMRLPVARVFDVCEMEKHRFGKKTYWESALCCS